MKCLPDAVVDEVVAVSAFASLLLFRLDDLPGTQLIVDVDPPLLLLALLLLCFFDFQSFILMVLNKITYSILNGLLSLSSSRVCMYGLFHCFCMLFSIWLWLCFFFYCKTLLMLSLNHFLCMIFLWWMRKDKRFKRDGAVVWMWSKSQLS